MRWIALLLLFLPTFASADFGRDPVLLKGVWYYTEEIDKTIDADIYQFINDALIDASGRMNVTDIVSPPTLVFATTTYMDWLFNTLMKSDSGIAPIAMYFNGMIYLSYGFDITNLIERGYAYHEAVHHIQSQTGRWSLLVANNIVCYHFMKESEAYDLQADWLDSQLFSDPKVRMSIRLLRNNAAKYRSHCSEIVP